MSIELEQGLKAFDAPMQEAGVFLTRASALESIAGR
jgi:hypothetical protein